MNMPTPGPWWVDTKNASESGWFDDVNIISDKGMAVAVAVQNNNMPADEVKYNAYILAASRDMLCALEAITHGLPELLSSIGYQDETGMLEMAYAAIRKANGDGHA